jgi:ABC-type antimicrobial peptide transport system permease subunit
MRELHVAVGDRVHVGRDHPVAARVVGEVLLPGSSHTDYDQSGWMTTAGVAGALDGAADTDEDYLLVRWKRGTDVAVASRRLAHLGGPNVFTGFAEIPGAVASLGPLDDLPVALGVFFGLLACATVAHALVTTVRRRRHDFAVLRSIGFTRRQSRVAIAWQATLLGIAGVIIGVPLGIATGRAVWRWLADDFPIAYVPPLALAAVILVVPLALVIANALAAGPAQSVARIRPAETLRTE